jgi:hypothetical protein
MILSKLVCSLFVEQFVQGLQIKLEFCILPTLQYIAGYEEIALSSTRFRQKI